MNISQKYKVERIITEIVSNNKDKTLNELKRLVKGKVEAQMGSKVASEVGIQELIDTITKNKLLRENKEEKMQIGKSSNIDEIEEMER